MLKFIDGAMGTLLLGLTEDTYCCPELYNVYNPAVVISAHERYIKAGADIIETNSFGANYIKLSEHSIEHLHDKINYSAVANARSAIHSHELVAASVGPSGKLLQPLGLLSFDEVCSCFSRQIRILTDAGADIIFIETMTDIQEMRAALIAAKSVCNLPVFCQMSYSADGRTLGGTDAATATVIMDKLGASVIGANCSTGPLEMIEIIKTIRANTNKPVSALPNAGIPYIFNNNTVFPMNPQDFSSALQKLVDAGASYIGGCCGTTPEHIACAKKHLQSPAILSQSSENSEHVVKLCSRTISVNLSINTTPKFIGERINPTNRKAMAEELRAGKLNMIINDAMAQQQNGAHVLDINVGINGINQVCTMKEIVLKLSSLLNSTLAIDTTDESVLEAGLRNYPGRALINSVSAETKRLLPFLKLAKKYGAAVLVLPVTDNGIPLTAKERCLVAKEIIHTGLDLGLSLDDFILDPLIFPVAAESSSAIVAMETVRMYRQKFKLPITAGLSNCSYGLPQRPAINASFLLCLIGAGVNVPIFNPLDNEIQKSMALLSLLYNGNAGATEFIAKSTDFSKTNITNINNDDVLASLAASIYNGNRELASELTAAALIKYSVQEISEAGIAAGMIRCGNEYNDGKLFLPHILMAAEAASAAFACFDTLSRGPSAGKIILGTVSGDIHDLGKNIVAALLSNSGFTVIDLGKNVSRETFFKEWQKTQADIIGFSALMTTTMTEIEPTISYLKNNGCTAKFIAGGAVVTASYAKAAGADAFAYDAVEAIDICRSLIENKI